VFQTAANLVRQKTQAIVQKTLERIGIEVELKAVNAGVFFSSDPGNPDTYSHFYADMQMFFYPSEVDPQSYLGLGRFLSWDIAQEANNWAGRNVVRWANAEYDRLWKEAETEVDPAKRAALFIRMHDLLIEDVVVIPVVWRKEVSAVSYTLRGLALSPWDSNLWDLAIGTGRPEDARRGPARAPWGHRSHAPRLPPACCAPPPSPTPLRSPWREQRG
jgi:peptide/nickel transport system substrate-binding protein